MLFTSEGKRPFETIRHHADVCVVGGGMSGLIAAVAAARHGAKVLLMQDRPVLGGNASGEIRMWIRGATHVSLELRETGILNEIELENIYRNPTMNFSAWDELLLRTVRDEQNIELLLNCSCLDCETEGSRILTVTGWQTNTYTFHRVQADIFIDCSGDAVLAPLSGAAYRIGREGRNEMDEYAAPEKPDRRTMGNSILIQARETDHPCVFKPVPGAYVYPDDESLYNKNHDFVHNGINFWWIELGGLQDSLKDVQPLGEELMKIALGVWDHIKNYGDHGAENFELDWIGFYPGKRESLRCEGDYMLNQRDLEEGHTFPDAVAYGGWTMDNHHPEGFAWNGYSSVHIDTAAPYQIPYRCLYSRNIDNLMFAGRNISASHMAMSSTRVMATCSVIGQAAGTAAALATQYGCDPRGVNDHMEELQRQLIADGCFIPGVFRPMKPLHSTFTAEQTAMLQNGYERPVKGQENRIMLAEGAAFTVYTEGKGTLRLVWDIDFSRQSVADKNRYRMFAMRCHIVA